MYVCRCHGGPSPTTGPPTTGTPPPHWLTPPLAWHENVMDGWGTRPLRWLSACYTLSLFGNEKNLLSREGNHLQESPAGYFRKGEEFLQHLWGPYRQLDSYLWFVGDENVKSIICHERSRMGQGSILEICSQGSILEIWCILKYLVRTRFFQRYQRIRCFRFLGPKGQHFKKVLKIWTFFHNICINSVWSQIITHLPYWAWM